MVHADAQEDLPASPSRDTIARCISKPEVPNNADDVATVAIVLARAAGWDPYGAAAQARQLWEKAHLNPTSGDSQDDGEDTGLSAAVRVAYLAAAIARYRVLELATLSPEAQDCAAPVLLRQVFEPQQVRADPPPLELPRDLRRRLVESGDLDPHELPDELDRELLATAREAHTACRPRPVLDVVTDPAQPRVVLLGDPGAGKCRLPATSSSPSPPSPLPAPSPRRTPTRPRSGWRGGCRCWSSCAATPTPAGAAGGGSTAPCWTTWITCTPKKGSGCPATSCTATSAPTGAWW